MKKLAYVLLAFLFLIGFHLTSRYLVNENYINNYMNGIYKLSNIKYLKILNIPDSYVAYFNGGNYYYQKKEYDKAIQEYVKALDKTPKSKICDVQLNLSLATLETLEYENNPKIREQLIAVQQILMGNDCAREDQNGKDVESQSLYDEIQELLDSAGGQGSGDPDDPTDPDDPDDPYEGEDIKEEIQNQQIQAEEEREEYENEWNLNYYNIQYW